jgi:hypothetical protein
MKTFIAITSEIKDGKLITLHTSNGYTVTNPDGLTFSQAINFLFGLRHIKRKDDVFICYAFQADNEYIFSQLPDSVKDKLFQSHEIREKIDDLENEVDELDYQLYTTDKDSENYELYDFERYVNKLSLKEFLDVTFDGFAIRLINGKLLTISQKGKRFILYDVYGFFRKTLADALHDWTGDTVTKTDCRIDAVNLVKLMTQLNTALLEQDINLSKFHGVTTVSSWLLSKTKAKDEYHSYKRRRQFGGESYKAIMQAYYGGRVEQFKIGTFNENVNVYDINSAYAYACSLLPVMRRKPDFANEWRDETFSLWFCDYDFSSVNPYYGLLPNRDVGALIKYKVRGKGYFWQPEVKFLLEFYPECIRIERGLFIPYQKANFTQGIIDLYNLRLELQKRNHPLEKILKLALSAIYGKFCQRDGYGYYYNMMYAGFITSMTRAQMLRAAKGYEQSTICFLTDAIHCNTDLPVSNDTNLGGWKKTTYSKAQYLDAGVYRLYDTQGNLVKEKTKGFRTFNFDEALKELQEFRTYTALSEFFVGHNLHTFMPMRFREYLEVQKESKKTNPFESTVRLYNSLGIDFTENWCESKIIDEYAGRESASYKTRYYKESDLAKDSLMAERI